MLDLNCKVQHAVSGWFANVVKSAIEPVFGTVGRSLLSTPRLDQWSRVSGMWTGSLAVANSVFVLMVVVAGLTLMGHQSLQTSYTVKDIAPRLVLGVVLSNMSLLLIGKAIYAANGLSAALVSQGVNVDQAANQMSTRGSVTAQQLRLRWSRKRVAVGLVDVEDAHQDEAAQLAVRFVLGFAVAGPSVADLGCGTLETGNPDPNGLLALADVPAELVPLRQRTHVRGARVLLEDHEQVVEAVAAQPRARRDQGLPALAGHQAVNSLG